MQRAMAQEAEAGARSGSASIKAEADRSATQLISRSGDHAEPGRPGAAGALQMIPEVGAEQNTTDDHPLRCRASSCRWPALSARWSKKCILGLPLFSTLDPHPRFTFALSMLPSLTTSQASGRPSPRPYFNFPIPLRPLFAFPLSFLCVFSLSTFFIDLFLPSFDPVPCHRGRPNSAPDAVPKTHDWH